MRPNMLAEEQHLTYPNAPRPEDSIRLPVTHGPYKDRYEYAVARITVRWSRPYVGGPLVAATVHAGGRVISRMSPDCYLESATYGRAWRLIATSGALMIVSFPPPDVLAAVEHHMSLPGDVARLLTRDGFEARTVLDGAEIR